MSANFWLENLKGRDKSEDLELDGTIILKWILENYSFGTRVGLLWFRTGSSLYKRHVAFFPSLLLTCQEQAMLLINLFPVQFGCQLQPTVRRKLFLRASVVEEMSGEQKFV
jgi:hypothetical protein